MSTIEEQNKGRKEGEIRYLTPLNISTTTKKKPHRQQSSPPNKSFYMYNTFKDRERERER